MDKKIFVDQDPGSQNLADPTDPKHCFTVSSKVGNPESELFLRAEFLFGGFLKLNKVKF